MNIRRKRTTFGLLIAFLWMMLLAGLVSAQEVNEKQLLDFMERIRNESGAPGVSLAIGWKGKLVFSKGIGHAELENRVPATGQTVHNIASISKTQAAVAIMQLVEQGKVDLDKPIQTYVPYFPRKRWTVTLRHILTHTSGIRHYRPNDFGPQRIKEKIHYESIKEGIKIFKDDTLLFKPGTYWYYSSYACNLMQAVVEEVTGLGFEEYLRTYVWGPAGMLSTQFDVPERIVPNRGKGYLRNKKGILVNIPYADVSYKYAGGGIISTAEDLVRFGLALNHGKLLKPETFRQMMTVQVDPVIKFSADGKHKKQSHKQALIWFIRTDAQGREFISHTGTVKGCRSYFLDYPGEDLVVALIVNILPFEPVPYGNAVAQLFLPPVHPGVTNEKK